MRFSNLSVYPAVPIKIIDRIILSEKQKACYFIKGKYFENNNKDKLIKLVFVYDPKVWAFPLVSG